MDNTSPLAKVIALAIVGGVAKALFSPPATYITQNIDSEPKQGTNPEEN